MKIIFKNILCSIIISSMLISVSCGNNSERISNSESNSENLKNSSETLESAETEPLHYAADVPESDFKGYAFTFLVRGNEAGDWGNYDICAEEINGEPVNDAVFNRNLAIEERYNVVISEYRTANNLLDTAKKGINAQDGSFDVIISSFWDAASLATDGYLHNLKEVEGIDLSQPWWDQRANEDLSIGNKLLFSVNDISILAAESTVDVYLFNKKMIGDFGLENPYDMVKNGTWTYDNMMSMMKGVASDLNGDGVMDENDRWGMANNGEGVLNSIFASAQQSYIKKDDKDIPYIAINNETALRAFEKTVTLMYNNPDVLDDATVMDKIFTE